MIKNAKFSHFDKIQSKFYNNLNNCGNYIQAFSLFCATLKKLFYFEWINLYMFADDSPFITSSLQIKFNSDEIIRDIPYYMPQKDINFIWKQKTLNIIKKKIINLSENKPFDCVVPLVIFNEAKGFLTINLHPAKKPKVLKNYEIFIINLSGYFASFLGLLEKSNKLSEKEVVLEETKEYVSNILENMVHGVISIDNDNNITTFSRGAEILLELNCDDVIRKNYHNIFPPQIAHLIDEIKDGLSGDKYIIEQETQYVMQGKYSIPIKFTASLLKNKQGSRAGIILVCKDSSTVKRLIALQELRNMKSDFLAAASHEFKTPLNLIMGSAGILSDAMVGGMNDQQRKLIDLVNEGSKRLNKLIGDLLDLSRMEHEQTQDIYEIKLSEALDDSLSILGKSAFSKNIFIIKQIENSDFKVYADYGKIRKIFDNLISNALKYTPRKGEVKIQMRHITNHKFPKKFYNLSRSQNIGIVENAVEIIVSDTGIGIAPENLDKIFEQFTRIEDDPVVRANEGTGLGLSITKGIIESIGGTISVKSRLGKGTEFTVHLPLSIEQTKIIQE